MNKNEQPNYNEAYYGDIGGMFKAVTMIIAIILGVFVYMGSVQTTNLSNQISELQELNEIYLEDISNINQDIIDVNTTINNINTTIGDVDILGDTVESISDSILDIKANTVDSISDINSKLASVRAALVSYTETNDVSIEELATTISMLTTDINKISDQILVLEGTGDGNTDSVSTLRAELDSLTEELRVADTAIQSNIDELKYSSVPFKVTVLGDSSSANSMDVEVENLIVSDIKDLNDHFNFVVTLADGTFGYGYLQYDSLFVGQVTPMKLLFNDGIDVSGYTNMEVIPK